MPTARASRALLALGLALFAGAAAAAELATLFHTPEERQRLDRLRRGEPTVHQAARSGTPAVTGYVKRSDGRNTVWIDGTPVVVGAEAAAALESRGRLAPAPGEVRIERRPAR